MKILTITSSYPKHEGDTTAPFIESITRALSARGHENAMVLPGRSDLAPTAIDGVRFFPYRYAPTSSLAVFGYAEALRADVAVRNATYMIAPLAVLSGAAKLAALARREAFDVVHAHWVVPNGAIAWLAGLGELPLVVSLHGSDVFLSEKKRVFARAARLAFGRASGATACSDDLADRSLALGARQRPETIPYGVDTELFRRTESIVESALALRRELGLSGGDPIVFSVGRLVHKKGFEYLIDALARLRERRPGLHLVLAGKGDLERELARRASAAGISDRVHPVGNVDRSTLPSYFAAADLVAVPSVRDDAGNVDGLPNVLLEAMASGAPIVASNVAGIPQAIEHERHGLLVPEKDPEALAEAIARLVDSREFGRSLGAAAERRVREEFSWKHAGEHYEDVLRSVAEAGRPKA